MCAGGSTGTSASSTSGWSFTALLAPLLLLSGCFYGAACSPIDFSYSLCAGAYQGHGQAEACVIMDPVEGFWEDEDETTVELADDVECMDLPGGAGLSVCEESR